MSSDVILLSALRVKLEVAIHSFMSDILNPLIYIWMFLLCRTNALHNLYNVLHIYSPTPSPLRLHHHTDTDWALDQLDPGGDSHVSLLHPLFIVNLKNPLTVRSTILMVPRLILIRDQEECAQKELVISNTAALTYLTGAYESKGNLSNHEYGYFNEHHYMVRFDYWCWTLASCWWFTHRRLQKRSYMSLEFYCCRR